MPAPTDAGEICRPSLVDRGGQGDRGGRAQLVLALLGCRRSPRGPGRRSGRRCGARARTVVHGARASAVAPSGRGWMLCGPCSTCRSPSAEFIALDTETNGLAGDRCELTEVGAVLVGGGELHERVGLAGRRREPARARDPALHRHLAGDGRRGAGARGRAAAAEHDAARAGAGRAQRGLRRARAAPGLRARGARVAGAAGAVHGRSSRAGSRRCSAGAGWRRWPARSGSRSTRSTARCPDARTCARVFCALFGRLCANAPTIGDAIALLGARKVRTRPPKVRARARRAAAPRRAAARAGRLHLPRRRRAAAVRRQVDRPAHAGALALHHRRDLGRATPSTSTTRSTESELGALLLEDRLIKALRPPGNVRGKAEPDGYVYLRCRLDIPFPILEVAREPAAGHAVCVGPVRGRAAAAELVEQLNSLFGLRHCGRTLPRREHPSAYGQMGRCLSPCLHDLDPNLYRERLDAALKLFVGRDGGAALLARVDEQIARGLAGAALRARGVAAAPARAARGAARAPRRRAAGDAHRRAARARAAPGGGRALRRDLDRGRPGRRLGPGGDRGRARSALGARASPRRPRPASSAAGCPRTPWRRRGWSAPGSPPTSPLPWNSGPGRGRRHTPPSSPGPGTALRRFVVDSVNVSVFA